VVLKLLFNLGFGPIFGRLWVYFGQVLIVFKKEFNNFWTFFLYIIFGQQGHIYQQEIWKIKILALFNYTNFLLPFIFQVF
jgi:hypothetical protein